MDREGKDRLKRRLKIALTSFGITAGTMGSVIAIATVAFSLPISAPLIGGAALAGGLVSGFIGQRQDSAARAKKASEATPQAPVADTTAPAQPQSPAPDFKNAAENKPDAPAAEQPVVKPKDEPKP